MVYWEVLWNVGSTLPTSQWKCSTNNVSLYFTPHDSNVRDWLWQRLSPWQKQGDYFTLLMDQSTTLLRVNHVANAFAGMFDPIVLINSASAKEIYDQIETYLFMIRTKGNNQ